MIQNIRRSLTDLLGAEYTAAVCRARAALTGESPEALRAVADEKVDFYPEAFARRQEELMGDIGHSLAPAFADTEDGAPTHSYRAAQHSFAAPLGGLGAFRIGEDGRLYFAGKSEHYQIPLGHDFPGYSLIENAKRLGIPNATHNNTRGFITRTLERRLIAAANGLQPTDPALDRILSQKEPGVLNTVINLETGSLAVEAALKMMFSPLLHHRRRARTVCRPRTRVRCHGRQCRRRDRKLSRHYGAGADAARPVAGLLHSRAEKRAVQGGVRPHQRLWRLCRDHAPLERGQIQNGGLLSRDRPHELRRHPPFRGISAGSVQSVPRHRHARTVRRDPVLCMV